MNIPPVFQDVEIKQSQNWLFTNKFEKLNFNKEKELEDTDFEFVGFRVRRKNLADDRL